MPAAQFLVGKKTGMGRASVGAHNSSSQVVSGDLAGSLLYSQPAAYANKQPEFITAGVVGVDETAHNNSSTSASMMVISGRDMAFPSSKMQQQFNRNSILPKITASAAGSLIQYSTASNNGVAPTAQGRTHHSLNPVKSEGGRSSQQNRAVATGSNASQLLNHSLPNASHQPPPANPSMSQNSAKGRLSSQMSPDERHKIQELRRKISEATKSHHGANSPRISAAAS